MYLFVESVFGMRLTAVAVDFAWKVKKRTCGKKTVRTRGFVRFIHAVPVEKQKRFNNNTVRRGETVEKGGFVRAPKKNARTVRNRCFVRFYSCGAP